jgi:hypothetical protein
MSEFSFAQDVNTLKYINGKDLQFLVEKHGITMEQAMDVMQKLGFDKGMDLAGNDEYWNKTMSNQPIKPGDGK